MRLVLVDSTRHYPSSPLFVEAAQELGDQGDLAWRFVDEAAWLGEGVTAGVRRRVGLRDPGVRRFNKVVVDTVSSFRPDVMLVVKGGCLEPETLKEVKARTHTTIVNFATDDPFNRRASTESLLASVPYYDVWVCSKRAIMEDVRNAGCKKVLYVPFAYKPDVHRPEEPASKAEARAFSSDVVFAGGCDNDRVPYLETLVASIRGLDLRLYGGYWDRHEKLRRYHCGVAEGRDYRLAIGGAKIALNLVRSANRDGHVMRSFEIPAIGGFMLAQPTQEHLELFGCDTEMGCFGTPEQLVQVARYYLARPEERWRIADAGHQRITSGGHRYADRLVAILGSV